MVLGCGLLGCGPVEDDDSASDDSAGGGTSEGDSESGPQSGSGSQTTDDGMGDSDSRAFELCPQSTNAADCAAARPSDGLCAWLELVPTEADGCVQGEPVGYCVEGVGEPGCGPTPGCGGESYEVTLPDGSIAPFVTCGGPYPPLDYRGCAADEGVCACVCDGDETTG